MLNPSIHQIDSFFHLQNSVGKNRYVFDKSSSSIHGDMMGLALTDGHGKNAKIKNLVEPIRLVIPNTEKMPEIRSYHAYCELMRLVHLVNCLTNASNIILKVKPWQPDNFTGNLFIFMNKGTREFIYFILLC